MLANVKGFAPVEIQLASGEQIRATLLVHHTWVKIVGNGAGATLDGQGTASGSSTSRAAPSSLKASA